MCFLLNEASLNVTSFRYCCLGQHRTYYLFIFRDRWCNVHFPGFDRYIFPQLQTSTSLVLPADCTEGSCLPDISSFKQLFSF